MSRSRIDPFVAVDKLPAKAVTCRSALAVSKFNQPTLPSEDLDGEFATVFTRHCPLHGFHQGRWEAPVVLKLLGAVVHADVGALADVFVVGAFVGVLESSLAADIVDEDDAVVSPAVLDIL